MSKKKEEIKETIKVVITSKFNCQSFPLNDSAIEITKDDLSQIGITKCFDVDNNCVIDYDNTEDEKKKRAYERINELKKLLFDSDYRAIKYAEGLYSDEEYSPYKTLRASYREEINALEEILKEGDQHA